MKFLSFLFLFLFIWQVVPLEGGDAIMFNTETGKSFSSGSMILPFTIDGKNFKCDVWLPMEVYTSADISELMDKDIE